MVLLLAVVTTGCATQSTITFLPEDGIADEGGLADEGGIADEGGLVSSEAAEFFITPGDQGSVLRVQVGDTVTARLPLADPTGPQWVVARVPDPLVLAVGDVFTWAPSEPGSGPAYTEFVFWVLGPGAATVVLNLEPGGTAATAVTFEFEAASG